MNAGLARATRANGATCTELSLTPPERMSTHLFVP